MTRRVLLLGVALAVALVGVALLYLYVRGAEQRALAARDVWVVRETVAAGTPVAQIQRDALVELAPVPDAAVLPDALGPADDLSGDDLADLVTRQQLLPGEQLVAAKLQSPGDTADTLVEGGGGPGDETEATDDLLLGSFQFADPERVAGFLRPESRVTVFYTFTAAGGPDVPPDTVTNVLLPAVEVAAVGSTTGSDTRAGAAEQQAGDVPEALVTLRVTPDQMARLVTARATGTLYLGLLPDGTDVGDVSVRSSQLTGGGAPAGAAAPPAEGVSP